MSENDPAHEPEIEAACDPIGDPANNALIVDTKETALAAALAAVSGADNEFGKLLAVRNGAEEMVRLGYDDVIDKLATAAVSQYGMSFTEVHASVRKGREHAERSQDAPPDQEPSIHEIGPSPEILKLAKLSPMEYERARRSHADRLGMRASVLDDFVKALRPKGAGKRDGEDEDNGFSEPHWDITLWSEPVNLDQLLNDITAVVSRYMVMDAAAIDAHALWTLNTFVRDVFDVAPYAHVSSPVPGCGKSRLMTLTNYMGYKTTVALDPSPPSIFRTIEAAHPAMLLDEVDRFITKKDSDLVGILNAGYKKSGYVLRMEEVDGKHVPRKFSPFCPKMLAGIGNLPRTLAERSIRLPLQKKKKGQKSTRLRDRDTKEFKDIRSKALRWVNDHQRRLEEIRDRDEVQFPDALGDREGETWEPLLAIALLAGEEWKKRALKAAESLSGAVTTDDDEYGTQLLEHIREIFEAQRETSLPSNIILQRLNENEEWPWREKGKGGKPMSLRAMQDSLKKFNIHAEPEALQGTSYGRQRGYLRLKFEEAWATYCKPRSGDSSLAPPSSDPSSCVAVSNAHGSGTSRDFRGVYDTCTYTPRKDEEMPANSMFYTPTQLEEGEGVGGQESAPHTCEYCGQPGVLVDVYTDVRAARLHRHCMESWGDMIAAE
jgi:Protein of unknown function (DUF3631)